jgi:hypothetical protein
MRRSANPTNPITRPTTALGAPSYRPQLLNSRAQGPSLLAGLRGTEGNPPPGPASDRPNPIIALEQSAAGEAPQVALIAAEPQVQRDIAQFALALTNAETPARLLADPTALKVLLTANGLADQIGDTALAARVLLSDPSRAGSLVNQLADKRWLSVNKTYCFATKGLALLENPGVIDEITEGYAVALWRMQPERTPPGLSNALDFPRSASTIGDVDQVIDVDQRLDDPTSRAVIATDFGVPHSTAKATREQAIAARIDLTHFRDPTFVSQFARQHLAAERVAASRNAGANTPDVTTPTEPSMWLVV